jgi:hypothetical protein
VEIFSTKARGAIIILGRLWLRGTRRGNKSHPLVKEGWRWGGGANVSSKLWKERWQGSCLGRREFLEGSLRRVFLALRTSTHYALKNIFLTITHYMSLLFRNNPNIAQLTKNLTLVL